MPRLEIVLNEAGQIAITGPLENEMLCYYLLEKAKQAVAQHHESMAKRLVQPAAALPFAVKAGS